MLSLNRAGFGLLCAFCCALLTSEGLLAASDTPTEKNGWYLNGIADGARVLRKGSPFWQYALRSDGIPAESDLEVPGEGGLIRSEIGAVTALNTARFWLPPDDGGMSLEQVQGDVRYRVNKGLERPFRIETQELSVLVSGAVFEIRAGALGTLVELIEGRADVSTKDGISVASLDAGQSARVSSTDLERLEIRRQKGANFVIAGLRQDGSSDNGGGTSGSEDRTGPEDESSDGPEESNGGDDRDTNDRGRNDNGGDSGSRGDKGESRDNDRGKGSDKGNSKGNDKGKGGGKGKDSGKGGGNGKGKDNGKGGGKGKK